MVLALGHASRRSIDVSVREVGMMSWDRIGRIHSKAVPLGLLSVLVVSEAFGGQPVVSGLSGAVRQGSDLSVSGSGFGAKASGQAAPVKFDDFENGVIGQSITTGRSICNAAGQRVDRIGLSNHLEIDAPTGRIRLVLQR